MKMKRMLSAVLALMMAVTMLTTSALADEKLRYDDRGAAVTQLQQMLNQLGYVTAVDGVFGPGTEAAVRQFQSDKGLKVDGIAGSATLAMLRYLTGTSGSTSTSGSGVFGGNYATMRPGESSSRVRVLQKALNDLGYNAGVEDGTYGKGTEAAVRWFQMMHNLSVDGKAGEKTLRCMESFFNADGTVRSDYTPPSATVPPAATNAPATSAPGVSGVGIFGGDYSKMVRGEVSGRVRTLQNALNALGYNAGKADGVYGAGTEAAVRWFQQVQNLIIDGKAGENTLRRMESFFNADGTVRSDYTPPTAQATANPGVPTTAPSVGSAPTRTLRPGDSGEDVRSVQARLQALGYYYGALDGKYGAGTEAAVYQFQLRNNIKADGKAGTVTNAILFSANAIPADSTSTSAPATAAPATDSPATGDPATEAPATSVPTAAPTAAPQYTIPTRILRPGDSGEDVRYVQARLQELGYYSGALDGKYGAATTAAVTQFQIRNNLTVDGKAGSVTNAVLFSANAIPAGVQSTSAPTAAPTTAPSTGSANLFGGVYTKMVRGEVSSRVRILQTALNSLGYSVGTADGVYGAATEAAVRLFQQRFNLTVDGKAGENTLRCIESCFNADGSVKSDYVPPATVTPAPTTTPSLTMPTRTLRPGDEGEDVRNVQARLQQLGYYTGVLDGKYGTGTTSAVFQFQLNNGLYADGKAGADTNARLFSDSAIPAGGTPTSAPTEAPTSVPTDAPTAAPTATPAPQYNIPSRTLRSGDSGEDVRTVQSRLRDLGYYTGQLDGVYGAGTVSAVTAFQAANSLNPDGKAGPLTYAVLFSDRAIPAGGSSNPTVTPGVYATLKKGDTGEAVTQLQKALLNLGYTVNTNGSYTNETVTAVKQFQSANGLNVDGIAGPLTFAKLYSGTAVGPSDTTNGPGSTTAGVMANPPSNSQIQLLHWYNDIKPNLSGQPTVQIYDPASGLTWNIKIFSKGQHADGEPPTLQDTQIMYKAFGNQFTWNEKPVFVKLPSGAWCIASMHDRPHESDMIKASVNGFAGTFNGVYEDGHLCIHFPRDMAETEKNAPKNGVRHQNDIRKKWKEMTGQDIPW